MITVEDFYFRNINRNVDNIHIRIKKNHGTDKKGRARKAKRERALPISVDWRYQGILGGHPPRQLEFTCWAIVAADLVEASLILNGIYDVTPSKQELVDCCFVQGATNGGSLTQALDRIMLGRVSNNVVYPPRTRARGTCKRHNDELPAKRQLIKIKCYHGVTCSERRIKSVVAKTPVGIAVICGGSTYRDYSGGVLRTGMYRDVYRLDRTRRTNVVGHAMTIIGYGEDEEEGPYWLIRNSYGRKWGENGLLRLHRSFDTFVSLGGVRLRCIPRLIAAM